MRRHQLALVGILLATVLRAAQAPPDLSPDVKTLLSTVAASPLLGQGRAAVMVQALGTLDRTEAPLALQPYADGTRPILFASREAETFVPASNMKLITGAAALDVLGPDYYFVTTARAAKPVDGEVPEIYLVGGGDPGLSIDDLRKLAASVRAAGVTTVRGDVICDAHRYQDKYPQGWTDDDIVWYYGPEVWGIALGRNQVDVTVRPGDNIGDRADLVFSPESSYIKPVNRLTTGPAAGQAKLEWDRDPATGNARVTGTVPLKTGGIWSQGMAVANVPLYAATVFRDCLVQAGVSVLGNPADGHWAIDTREIARLESPPLKVLLRPMLKRSDNLYAEMFNRELGYYTTRIGSALAGEEAIRTYLRSVNVPEEGLVLPDGSGLSRRAMVTPRALLALLNAAIDSADRDIWWDCLPIAGVDGTISGRMKGTSAQGNVHAKTGSLSGRSSLSGYVRTKSGDLLAVVTLFNDYACSTGEVRGLQDQVFTALADWQR